MIDLSKPPRNDALVPDFYRTLALALMAAPHLAVRCRDVVEARRVNGDVNEVIAWVARLIKEIDADPRGDAHAALLRSNIVLDGVVGRLALSIMPAQFAATRSATALIADQIVDKVISQVVVH